MKLNVFFNGYNTYTVQRNFMSCRQPQHNDVTYFPTQPSAPSPPRMKQLSARLVPTVSVANDLACSALNYLGWIQTCPLNPFTIAYVSPLILFTWRSEWKRVSESGQPLSVRRLYTLAIAVQCGIEWVHSITRQHYGFGHHYKWLSPQRMPYLRI